MTRLNTSSTYTYRPAEEARKARQVLLSDALYAIGTIAVFAFIGVLLAYRG